MARPRLRDERRRRVTQTIRVPRYVSDWIDRQELSAGELVEVALLDKFEIIEPKERRTKDRAAGRWKQTI